MLVGASDKGTQDHAQAPGTRYRVFFFLFTGTDALYLEILCVN